MTRVRKRPPQGSNTPVPTVAPNPPGAASCHLAELAVENLAVVERVRIPLGPGFVACTGETGVGKSLLVGAVRLLAGGRASSQQIRSGCDKAEVEGVFRHVPEAVWAVLAEAGIDAPAQELVVRRVIAQGGEGAAYVNDRRVGLALLAQVGAELIDVQGQHAHRSLLSEAAHGALLDGVGGLVPEVAAYRAEYGRLKDTLAAIAAAEAGLREAEARTAFLDFALEEIGAVGPEAGEDDALAEELGRLGHAERLKSLSEEAYSSLYADPEAVLGRLGRIAEAVAEITAVTPAFGETGKLVAEARVLLEEAADALRRFRDETRADPAREADASSRLGRLEGLKRKYGRTLAEVLGTAQEFERERRAAGDLSGRLEALGAERDALLKSLSDRAERLHAARGKAAGRLCAEVGGHFARLAMPHARLEVEISGLSEGISAGKAYLGPEGRDRVRFLLAANPGEDAKPLAKVASGGELSRILLAIKRVLIDVDPLPVLVFDEVDAGIGGAVAAQVGRMLQALARGPHQVFCVTHLPQIASLADRHLRVTKETDGARTRTRVDNLDSAARVDEVARMLGGARVTETTVEHAREMLAAG
jgi:DNA repair protein RecN (Recombination protein N)